MTQHLDYGFLGSLVPLVSPPENNVLCTMFPLGSSP